MNKLPPISAEIRQLTALWPPVARPGLDVFSAAWVMLVTTFFHALPHLAQLLGIVVLMITVWEKPTVQAAVDRLRMRLTRKDDDEAGR